MARSPATPATTRCIAARPRSASPRAQISSSSCRTDLPDALAAVMAVSQRPVTLSCLGTPSGPAGWKTLPSWYMVASNDNAIPPVAERATAARAGAHTVEISSSHVAFISHPQETTDLILAAVQGS